MRPINLIVIHCSATDINHDIHDVDEWHKLRHFKRSNIPLNAKNKVDLHVGYHFIVDKKGVIFPCRDESEIGSHVKGYNSESLGICLLGSDLFTEIQFTSARFLVASLLMKYNLENQHVLPHNALDKMKSCPRFDVNEKILKNIFAETLSKEN